MEQPPVASPGFDLSQKHPVSRWHRADYPPEIVEKLTLASEVLLIKLDEPWVARTHILLDSQHFLRVDDLDVGNNGASQREDSELTLERSLLAPEKRRHQGQRDKREEGNAESGDPPRPPDSEEGNAESGHPPRPARSRDSARIHTRS